MKKQNEKINELNEEINELRKNIEEKDNKINKLEKKCYDLEKQMYKIDDNIKDKYKDKINIIYKTEKEGEYNIFGKEYRK